MRGLGAGPVIALWLAVSPGGTAPMHAQDTDSRQRELEERLKSVEEKLERVLRELEVRGQRGDRGPRYAGRAITSWVEDLGDLDSKVRGNAERALEACGAVSVKPLLAALESDDAFLRKNAMVLVGSHWTEPGVKESAFRHARDSDARVRAAAVRVLGSRLARTDDSQGIESALLEALKDPDNDVKTRAAVYLAANGSEAARAQAPVELILEAFRPDKPEGNAWPIFRDEIVFQAVEKLNIRARSAVPTLFAYLDCSSAREPAAKCLAAIGPAALDAGVNAEELLLKLGDLAESPRARSSKKTVKKKVEAEPSVNVFTEAIVKLKAGAK